MATKILMQWDVRPEMEAEYFEFLVHEFIPGLNQLGIGDIQVWYTVYGECEQKLATGLTDSIEQMKKALHSKEWHDLIEKLDGFVNDFAHKVVNGRRGFQL